MTLSAGVVIVRLAVDSILLGGTYALLALGLSMVYGVVKILNIAYGGLYALGGYFGYSFGTILGLSPIFSLILTVIVAFGLGMLLERIFVEPVSKNYNAVMMVTFGLAILIEQVIILTYGPYYVGFPSIAQGSIVLGSIVINLSRFFAFGLSVFVAVLVMAFVYRTKQGLALRVVAFDPELASIRGINVRSSMMLTFGISTALVSVAASLILPTQTLYPDVGWTPLLISFVIVILGGLGNLIGTLIAGFFYAFVEVFVSYYLSSQWQEVIVLLAIVLVLLVRPQGIFGIRSDRV